jgi:hydrogenase-4 component B
LIYFGLMGSSRGGVASVAALLATGLFAFVGALTALCFVRLVGVVCLGERRGTAARKAHESPIGMTGPMGLLILGVVGLSIFPQVLLQVFPRVLHELFGLAVADQLQHVQLSVARLGMVNAALLAGLAAAAGVWVLLRRARTPSVESIASIEPPIETWGCGYAAPTARMQYTARSFSELVCDRLFPSYLRALTAKKMPAGVFPAPGEFSSQHKDPLTRTVYEPFFLRWADRFARLRWVQQGALHIYLLYIFVVAVVALGWVSWSTWLAS